MKKWCLLVMLAAAALAGTGLAAAHDPALRNVDGRVVPFDQMIEGIKDKDIIFIGEIHDNPDHHRVQLAVIDALGRTEGKLAIGLEMFRADNQKELDRWVAGELPEDIFKRVYSDNWQPSWELYRPIFLHARDRRIPLVGLNVPAKLTRKVAREGFASLSEDEMAGLPPGISCKINPAYMDFLRKAYSTHGRNDREFMHFCEAQMVWDSAMARHLIHFLKNNPGHTVVILAGSGHAWKPGIPEQIKLHSQYSSAVILPEVPEHLERGSPIAREADYILLYH
jgi:uncharacterized iron-regulated protein